MQPEIILQKICNGINADYQTDLINGMERKATEARALACYVAFYGAGIAQKNLQQFFKRKQHTDIIYYLKTINNRQRVETDLRQRVATYMSQKVSWF